MDESEEWDSFKHSLLVRVAHEEERVSKLHMHTQPTPFQQLKHDVEVGHRGALWERKEEDCECESSLGNWVV